LLENDCKDRESFLKHIRQERWGNAPQAEIQAEIIFTNFLFKGKENEEVSVHW
jgi:hypothetical protein